ncbi:very long-chain acyl-CoA synthetase-like [Meleagris gallopavo]|uniref:very long-chain acyl-CoA synthetase-like n=1 Tax=Meleagris gallopavo TaxID=9103 RepID=UPI000549B7D1|nr:very long-chain acyl-CoA synthetase-like [Meleagris gallopavo]
MLGVLVAAVAGLLLLLLHGHWFPFLWADLGAFVTLVGSSLRCRWRLSRRPPITLLQVFQSHARRRPQHPLLLFQDEVHTFGDVERKSNRAARAFALHLGLQPGQTVAVFLPNVPSYVWTWLALAKLGCAMACLNCNVRGRALLHARSAARADIVLSCSELQAVVEEVLPDLKQEGVRVFYLNSTSPTPGVEALLPAIEAASDEPMPDHYRTRTTTNSKAIYIYTSGTTGLPKAAVVTEMKVMMVANLARMCGLRENDVVYTTLPLYHSAGLLIGVGGCLEVGMCPMSLGGWPAWVLGQLDWAEGDGQVGKCAGRGKRMEREMTRRRKRSCVRNEMSEERVDVLWIWFDALWRRMDGQICGRIYGDGWTVALRCCVFFRDGWMY